MWIERQGGEKSNAGYEALGEMGKTRLRSAIFIRRQ